MSTQRSMVDGLGTDDSVPMFEALEPRTLLSAVMTLPSDANVLNVTSSTYGAVVNDGQDDTAAIQNAIYDRAQRRAVQHAQVRVPAQRHVQHQ